VLITASYRNQELVRVGYYVNNEYEDPELRDNPPIEPIFDKLVRTIATDQPRVTKFKINWDSESAATVNGESSEQAQAETNGQFYNNSNSNNANGQMDTDMACDDNNMNVIKPNQNVM
jgi:histone chaperone ASF1